MTDLDSFVLLLLATLDPSLVALLQRLHYLVVVAPPLMRTLTEGVHPRIPGPLDHWLLPPALLVGVVAASREPGLLGLVML